jgi:hypothetical protein
MDTGEQLVTYPVSASGEQFNARRANPTDDRYAATTHTILTYSSAAPRAQPLRNYPDRSLRTVTIVSWADSRTGR